MATDIIARGMASSAGGGGGGGDLPDASKEGQVLTSNAQKKPVWSNVAPLADNLLANPINNDAMYSSGPTGGLADISTGEEAYLQEVKGMSIVWNQLYDGSLFTTNSSHIYVRYKGDTKTFVLINQTSDNISGGGSDKIYDLTLMFGGNDKILFSMADEVEYPANGTYPQQSVNGLQRFQRLFANVDLTSAPYDAGTIKNVKATKLVETGRNLWNENDTDMVSNGIKLVAGYRYEVYTTGSNYRVQISKDNGTTWEARTLYRYQRANGAYIWVSRSNDNQTILMKEYSSSYPIKYVGFVHSGNYCLTSGTLTSSNESNTDVTIPAYQKHEFNIDLGSTEETGLNGLVNNNGEIAVYDTKDYRRVGSLDLSDYQNDMTWDAALEFWIIPASVLPSDIDYDKINNSIYLTEKMMDVTDLESQTEEGNTGLCVCLVGDTGTTKPSGTLLYPLIEPVATGESAFEPIALKSGDTWVVDDMGSEYFIQPANTNCPVNQVSYYYENLKDKLANMQEPVEVAAASYDYSKPSLNGLKIGDVTYKLAVQGSNIANVSVALGGGSDTNNYQAVAVGYNAKCVTQNTVALGYQAFANSSGAIAIGSNAYNSISNSFTCDGGSDSSRKIYHCYSPEKVFFRFENSMVYGQGDITKAKYGHYLSEYIQNNALVLESGKYYISYSNADNYKTFSNNRISGTDNDITSTVKGVHLIVKLSNNVVASLDLLPYDSTNSQAFTAYGIASDTPTFVSAYIDADGCVVLTLPADITAEEVLYTLK